MKKLFLTVLFLFLLIGDSWPYTTISSISSNQIWSSGTYYIDTSIDTCDYTVTINAGVIVKMGSGISLQTDGLTINGTAENPVYITSMNDDSVGEEISGSNHTPVAGDWSKIGNANYPSSPVDIEYGYILYSSTGIDFDQIPEHTHTVNNSIIRNCSIQGFGTPVNQRQTLNISNSQIDTCVSGIGGNQININATNVLFINNITTGLNCSYASCLIKNCTFDSNGYGVSTSVGGNLTVTDSIISNNVQNYYQSYDDPVYGQIDLNYVNQYGNTTTKTYANSNTNSISGDPSFVTGSALTGYVGDMTYFLNQATSVAKDAGSDTSANLSMNTYTTATDKTLDDGTVDAGYHYNPDDVLSGGSPPATRRRPPIVSVY